MAIKSNRTLSRCFDGPALGALIAIAFVPTAMAQWMPPWGAAFPGEIEQSLEAQGYVLTAPLMRRPGVYSLTSAPAPPAISVSLSTPEADKSLSASPLPAEIGDPRSPPAREGLASLKTVASDRRSTAAFPGRPQQPHRRRDRLTAVQRTSIFPQPSALTTSGKRGPERRPSRSPLRRSARRPSTRPCRPPLHVKRRKGTDRARRRPSRPRTMIPSSRGSTRFRPASAMAPRPPRSRLRARPPRRATNRR